MKKRFTFPCGTLAVAAVLLAAPLGAAVLQVDDDGVECPNAAYSSIIAAIGAASPGDEVEVCPGLYTEAPTINMALTLRAQTTATAAGVGDPAVNAIIDGGPANVAPLYLVRVNAGDVTIQGFEIRNPNYYYTADPYVDPSLVLVGTWGSPQVDNVDILDNILHDACDPTIPSTNGAQAINWNNAHGRIAGNEMYDILTGDTTIPGKGRGIWLSTPSDGSPLQRITVEDNSIHDTDRWGIGMARIRASSSKATPSPMSGRRESG